MYAPHPKVSGFTLQDFGRSLKYLQHLYKTLIFLNYSTTKQWKQQFSEKNIWRKVNDRPLHSSSITVRQQLSDNTLGLVIPPLPYSDGDYFVGHL
jgi:hypothetical protein